MTHQARGGSNARKLSECCHWFEESKSAGLENIRRLARVSPSRDRSGYHFESAIHEFTKAELVVLGVVGRLRPRRIQWAEKDEGKRCSALRNPPRRAAHPALFSSCSFWNLLAVQLQMMRGITQMGPGGARVSSATETTERLAKTWNSVHSVSLSGSRREYNAVLQHQNGILAEELWVFDHTWHANSHSIIHRAPCQMV